MPWSCLRISLSSFRPLPLQQYIQHESLQLDHLWNAHCSHWAKSIWFWCLPNRWLGRNFCLYKKPHGDQLYKLSSQTTSEPDKCLPVRRAPWEGQQSAFSLSKELSILVKVFLIRRAVSLADGFWYQHSFINLARDVNVWEKKKKQDTCKYINHESEKQ